ncbi:hypothetical protein BTN49_1630 [Candidatus Enterovibrio escicola]|uniref:Uncharacterized protein n=1 Tax=Candidatus Enterovibrio escicola TaxID=1927127 RepID=A0A2A5T3I2_9GAMM|nr:hypothetical protein BTN49_1630 [Candidatus Enterovibrio escacola]
MVSTTDKTMLVERSCVLEKTTCTINDSYNDYHAEIDFLHEK